MNCETGKMRDQIVEYTVKFLKDFDNESREYPIPMLADIILFEVITPLMERILKEFDCLTLAPNDNVYYRILVEDTIAYIRTGKRSSQLAREKWQSLQPRPEGKEVED